MMKRFSRPAPVQCLVESLESRTLLCGAAGAFVAFAGESIAPPSSIATASKAAKKAPTQMTLAFGAATLGSPITFTVTVRAAAAEGSPTGAVNIMDHRTVLQSVTLAPMASGNPKFAYSDAVYTLTQQPGGTPYYFGKHPITATFTPDGAFNKSSASKSFTVSKPTYTVLPDGVEYDTVVRGAGPAIADGQTANSLYTGYLAKNGHVFDYSIKDGGTPFPYTVGAGDVITGFDEGTVGMQAGETRIIYIPAAEGYGAQGSPPVIPANADLIFLVTLESIG